jgi:hypothetical protein
MIILLLLFLLITHIKFGAFVLFQIIIWLIVYFLSTFISGINPSNIQFKIIRLLSIFVIAFILWHNSLLIPVNSLEITTIIFPVSIGSISYLHDSNKMIYFSDSHSVETNLYLWNKDEISDFLKNELDKNETYIVSMEFIPSKEDIDAPQLILSKPFLINQYSSTTTIEMFINERLEFMIDIYYLDDSIIQPNKDKIGPIIKLTCHKCDIL